MAGYSGEFEEPLCLSALTTLQKSVDQLTKSLDEKIPLGMMIRPSPTSALLQTTTLAPLGPPLPLGLNMSVPDGPPGSMIAVQNVNVTSSNLLADYFLLFLGSAAVWMTIVILTLLWIRFSDLGYRTTTVRSLFD
jgi:hypothetical protein